MGSLCQSRNFSVSSKLSNLLANYFYFFKILISVKLVLISPVLFPILAISVISIFFLVSLSKDMSNLLIFQTTSFWFH